MSEQNSNNRVPTIIGLVIVIAIAATVAINMMGGNGDDTKTIGGPPATTEGEWQNSACPPGDDARTVLGNLAEIKLLNSESRGEDNPHKSVIAATLTRIMPLTFTPEDPRGASTRVDEAWSAAKLTPNKSSPEQQGLWTTVNAQLTPIE